MSLPSGSRLGPYEIVSSIGAGGMGEVYRAKDTRLNRTVAIKILPVGLAADSEFRARFDREARTLSQLNHPNVCVLFDVGRLRAQGASASQGDEVDFLVMEHLAGETLADRLKKGALPIAEVLELATEIADALDTAHRLGIVHRDLKPGNIMLTKSGSKLLDFGLAKSHATALAGAETQLHASGGPITARGTILGTFQYMAPEQLEGKDADARSDIWALGCVLYEMTTGKRAFEGQTQASIVAAILERDPTPMTELQPLSPPALARIVRTCLAKDPDARFQSAHDLGLQLRWMADGPSTELRASGSAAGLPGPVVAPRNRRERSLLITAAMLFGLLIGTAAWLLKPAPPPPNTVVTRFNSLLPTGQAFTGGTSRRVVAISPDGTKVAYIANEQIYLRGMNQLEAQPIRGSDENPYELTFSPDGQWIAYFARPDGPDMILRKISVAGGTPVTLCPTPLHPDPLSWRGNTISFAQYDRDTLSAIQTVADGGGPAQSILTLDGNKERVVDAQLLDDGVHVLMAVAQRAGTGTAAADIVVQSLQGGERKVLVKGAADPRLLRSGHLLYMREGTVFAVSIDTQRFEITGVEVPVVEGLARGPQFDVADNGTLVFVPGVRDDSPRRNLVWVDRQGQESAISAPTRAYQHLRLSPDGKQVAVEIRDEEHDIWIWDLASAALTRLTFDQASEGYPVWTRDSRRVFYRLQDGTGFSIVRRAADGTGTPQQLFKGADEAAPISVSLDGKSLVYRGAGTTRRDLRLLPIDPVGPPKPLIQTAFSEDNGQVSPDGRWIAYESDESGQQRDVFVRPFPAVDTGKVKVSSGGGFLPMWSRDGRELFYVTRVADAPTLASVAVPEQPPGGSPFTYGKRDTLFSISSYFRGAALPHDISLDGRKFLMIKMTAGTAPPSSITVVTHWMDELRARVKGK